MDPSGVISKDKFDAVLFDLDGVLTATASIHAACWKEMFDDFLRRYSEKSGEAFRPFEIETDYRFYVDGRRRFEGVRNFLESRGIHLEEGEPNDPPSRETICGLGNRKNDMVNEEIRSKGVKPFAGSVALVRHLREAGLKTAVVSASANCQTVLEGAGIADLFDVQMSIDSVRKYKPHPDTYRSGAERLGIPITDMRLVAAHDWDVTGAIRAGATAGFVARSGMVLSHASESPDVIGRDLDAVVSEILRIDG